MMSRITTVARTALNCVVVIALAMPLAMPLSANAAAAVAPPPPPAPAPAPPKPKPYQSVVQSDVAGAYEYRTRILGSPGCQRFATESDAAFLDDKLDDKVKAARLKKIGAEAAAAGCLTP